MQESKTKAIAEGYTVLLYSFVVKALPPSGARFSTAQPRRRHESVEASQEDGVRPMKLVSESYLMLSFSHSVSFTNSSAETNGNSRGRQQILFPDRICTRYTNKRLIHGRSFAICKEAEAVIKMSNRNSGGDVSNDTLSSSSMTWACDEEESFLGLDDNLTVDVPESTFSNPMPQHHL